MLQKDLCEGEPRSYSEPIRTVELHLLIGTRESGKQSSSLMEHAVLAHALQSKCG